jgi:hypothetical protein
MPVMLITGAHEAAAAIGGLGVKVHAGIPPLVAHYGQLYQTAVRARASGRPGPRVQTGGGYRTTIGLVMTTYQGLPAAIVGTNSPQGRRLEYGYADTDAAGRTYKQDPARTDDSGHVMNAPLPHFEPDMHRINLEMEAAIARLVESGMRSA